MGAVSETSGLPEGTFESDARVKRLVSDLDAIAAILPKAFARSRLETVRLLASDVAAQSQTIRLTISLERPLTELLETVETLRASLAQLRLMSMRTRIEQGTMLSLLLIDKFSGSLSQELSALLRAR